MSRSTSRGPSRRTIRNFRIVRPVTSPSSRMFLMCSLTVGTVTWNNSAISAWLSQSVSSTKRHSTRVRPSSVWYRTISPVGGAGLSGIGGRADDIPMIDLRLKPGVRQGPADLLGNHHRPMMAAGTAEGDRQVTLSFANVMRQQVDQQVCDPGHKFRRLRKRTDVLCHAGVLPVQVLEPWNVVGIRQKPDVKHQVAIRRHSIAKSEAGDVDLNGRLIALPAETLTDKIAQLVDGEPGGVDDQVRHGADRRQLRAFALDAAGDGLIRTQRMRPAGLTEAADDGVVVRLQKEEPRGHRFADAGEDFGKHLQPGALANIHHQGCRVNGGIVARQLGELRDQFHRQVVDGVEAQILQGLQDGTLARSTQPGDDHQFGFVGGRLFWFGSLFARHVGGRYPSTRSKCPSRRRSRTFTRSVWASR